MFTKSLRDSRMDYICNKLDSYDIYDPTLGGVLRMFVYKIVAHRLQHVISYNLSIYNAISVVHF